MITIMERNQKWLLRQFHTLCSRSGLTPDEKAGIIASYGHVSSKDMSDDQLKDACHKMEMQLKPKWAELDTARKRAMAAIGAYIRFCGKEESAQLIKGIACRATGYTSFNDIPADRLRNIYSAFKKKLTDYERSFREMEELYRMPINMQNNAKS